MATIWTKLGRAIVTVVAVFLNDNATLMNSATLMNAGTSEGGIVDDGTLLFDSTTLIMDGAASEGGLPAATIWTKRDYNS